jgi:hypothetical protein
LHHAAAQHPIQLGKAGVRAHLLDGIDIGQHAQRDLAGIAAAVARRAGRDLFFLQTVPGTTFRTLSHPFGRLGTALGAGIDGFGLGHLMIHHVIAVDLTNF